MEKVGKPLSSDTCINFTYRAKAIAHDLHIRGPHFKGTIPTNKCSSAIGQNENHIVWLCKECSKGTITHELIHALGFHHEHTRLDRDHYVAVHKSYIMKDYMYNFQKVRQYDNDTTNLNIYHDLELPYDLKSIMHYEMKAFAKSSRNPTITMISEKSGKDEGKGKILGQRIKTSSLDVYRICKRYNCRKCAGEKVSTYEGQGEGLLRTISS